MSQRATAVEIYHKLRESQFRCALTGWDISQDNFELDHIVSIQDGGSDEASNLQCVHPLANRAKGTMGNQQFIDMCKAVASHSQGTPEESRDEMLAELKSKANQLMQSTASPPGELGSKNVLRN